MISKKLMILMMAVFIMLVASGANLFLPALLLAGTVDLPRTGQTESSAAGDDGAIQAGVPWPSLDEQESEKVIFQRTFRYHQVRI